MYLNINGHTGPLVERSILKIQHWNPWWQMAELRKTVRLGSAAVMRKQQSLSSQKGIKGDAFHTIEISLLLMAGKSSVIGRKKRRATSVELSLSKPNNKP